MEGFVASPSLAEGEFRPGILLIHDWTGLQGDARERAIQIAEELGYVCFAADVYGKGVRPSNPQECGVQAGLYRKDRSLFRQRLKDALEQLTKMPALSEGAAAHRAGRTISSRELVDAGNGKEAVHLVGLVMLDQLWRVRACGLQHRVEG